MIKFFDEIEEKAWEIYKANSNEYYFKKSRSFEEIFEFSWKGAEVFHNLAKQKEPKGEKYIDNIGFKPHKNKVSDNEGAKL